jgi:hypothetical protein
MKKTILAIICAASMASCASGPGAQTGTVIGGLGGAAAGGIIGNQSGRGLEGAAIGGAIGAAAGNMIGNSRDQRNFQRGWGGHQGGWGGHHPNWYGPGTHPGFHQGGGFWR